MAWLKSVFQRLHFYFLCVCLLSLEFVLIEGSTSKADAGEVAKHLELGKLMMAKGQLQDALTHFHAALEGDPKNYLTLYRRATVYLALGRSRPALDDLNQLLAIKPDFVAARVTKGNILLKLGRLDEAHKEYDMVLSKESSNDEALRGHDQSQTVKKDYESAQDFYEMRDYEPAAALFTKIIETCPWDISLREKRSDCYLALGETTKAISDLKATTKLASDNTGSFMKLAKLHYQLGEAEESLGQVRECLKLDPDHKECFPHYKKVKKVAKFVHDLQEQTNANNYAECISTANKLLKAEPSISMLTFQADEKLCHCKLHSGDANGALDHCSAALRIKAEPRILCDRAEAYINSDLLDEAQQDYSKALELDDSFQRAKEGLQRVQKLQKQAKKRDYYKILGLKRSATKREVIKAYRKLAQQWHPDNFKGDEQKQAEKKFIDIAAAKEVLTNPEKRQKFDHGEDPLDPESQQGQGFNPFQQGFHQNFHHGSQGGGPFQFKFHFN